MTDFALDLWQEIADLQNAIIENEGEIQRDDKRLWKPYLNKMLNEDWIEILGAVQQLYNTHPEVFKEFHLRTIKQACQELVDSNHPRVLDTRHNKGLEWNLLMVLREVWNECKHAANTRELFAR